MSILAGMAAGLCGGSTARACAIRIPAIALVAAALTGCATLNTGVTPSEWSQAVSVLTVAVPLAEAVVAADIKDPPASLTKAEAALNADLAALPSAPAPTNAAAVLADVQVLVAVPASTLSAAHQAEVDALLAGAKPLAAIEG